MQNINKEDLIPLHGLDMFDRNVFPDGTEFIPVTYIENGEEKLGFVAITPDTLSPDKFETEKARILDIVIDKNLKNNA